MIEHKLPSGATLSIDISTFPVAKTLYQAVLRELKSAPFTAGVEIGEMLKELFCTAFSSPQIEACVWECFKRCAYTTKEGVTTKITAETFEPVEARGDYVDVCLEVTKENIAPFMKGLIAALRTGSVMLENIPKLT